MIAGKVWGETREILRRANFEVHRITIDVGGFSSIHSHRHKFNAFFVEHGSLLVRVWKSGQEKADETMMSSGDTVVVAPGERHQFEALTDTVAYEIYWVDLDGNDIIRETVGGKK